MTREEVLISGGFQDALTKNKGGQILVPLTNDNFIWLHRGEVGLTLNSPLETGEYIWDWRSQNTITYDGRVFKLSFASEFDPGKISPSVTAFDADLLPDELILSKRKIGDKMIPFGGTRPVKLKKILTERKLTAIEKENIIILRTNDGTIIWVPTVRHSTFATVTKQSSRIAYIEIINKSDD